MYLKDLKQNMILPKKEILIDKIVKIKEIDVHLLSITLEERRNVFWIMYKNPYNFDLDIDLEEIQEYTNRDEMIDNISKEMNDYHFYISEITIQNQKMTFSSSRSSRIHHNDYEAYMRLQHFIESGISTENWDKVNLSDILIASYEQKKDEEFPQIDISRELDITVKISENPKQVLINQPINLEFGEMQKGKKLYFYDSIEKKDRTFYINRMYHYDIWEEVNNNFEDERMNNFTEDEIKKMKENLLDALKKICPKGMSLAVLEYETEDDIQLNFYSKAYLDKKPLRETSSAGVIFSKSDKEFGINGFKNRTCMITCLEKDFNESIDAELFSWYLQIPEEIITI